MGSLTLLRQMIQMTHRHLTLDNSDNGDYMQDFDNFDFDKAFTAAEQHEQNMLDFSDMPALDVKFLSSDES